MEIAGLRKNNMDNYLLLAMKSQYYQKIGSLVNLLIKFKFIFVNFNIQFGFN